VDLNLTAAINSVRVAMKETSDKAGIRRLQLYADDIKCKPGCSACCARLIVITVAEALIIQESLEKSGQWEHVEKRARAQVKIVHSSSPVSWFKMNIMCPVLDPVSKLCTAYDERPSPCSVHFVKSDPSQCDPWATASGKFELISFQDLHDQFREFLEKTIDGYSILALKVPLPIALIFASRIKVQSNIGPGEMMSLIFNELA
jgi:Fe-S-cluster containining protein